MKRIVFGLFIVLFCILVIACKKSEENTATNQTAVAENAVSINLADGIYGWFVNADEVGSSVEGFENTDGILKFSFNRAVEVAEDEKWTWAEIMVTTDSADWSGFTGIEMTYKSDKILRVILCDSELEENFDAAAGFFAVLPISLTDTTVVFNVASEGNFVQHNWVYSEFPNIRRTIDNSKLYGIKIGTNAMGETTNATISKFILKGVVGK